MTAATRLKALQDITARAKALSVDMNAFNVKHAARARKPAGNVGAVLFSIEQLARAVDQSDAFDCPLSPAQIAHVLEVALKCKLGVFCLGGATAHIDLGNGHQLVCQVEPIGARQ